MAELLALAGSIGVVVFFALIGIGTLALVMIDHKVSGVRKELRALRALAEQFAKRA